MLKKLKQWAVKKFIASIIGGQMFQKIQGALAGKKSYLVALITAILGLLQAYGVNVPEWIHPILGALGLATLRAGVAKNEPPKQ